MRLASRFAQRRLASVSPEYTSEDEPAALGAGFTTQELLLEGMALAWRSPIQGARLGLRIGAELPGQVLISGLVLSSALLRWGEPREAQKFLRQLVPLATAPHSAHLLAWQLALAADRLGHACTTPQRLVGIADALAECGDLDNAWRCRLDAVAPTFAQGAVLQAQRLLAQASDYFTQRQMQPELATAHALSAYLCLSAGHKKQALEALHQAEVVLPADMPMLKAYLILCRIHASLQSRHFDAASSHIAALLTLAEGLGHRYYRLLGQLELLTLIVEKGDLRSVPLLYRAVSQAAQRAGLRPLQARIKMLGAGVELRRGAAARAASLYSEARASFEASGSRVSMALCTLNLGVAAQHQGRCRWALRLLHTAERFFAASELQLYQAAAHHNLGKAYASLQANALAEKHFSASARLLTSLENSAVIRQRAVLFKAAVQRSAEGVAQARYISAQQGERFETALAEHLLAGVMVTQSDLLRAAEAARRAAAAFDQLSQASLASQAWLRYADAIVMAGQPSEAEAVFGYIDLCALPGDLHWVYLRLMARLSAHTHRPDTLENYREAQRRFARLLHDIPAEERGRWQPARSALFDEAFAAGISGGTAQDLLEISALHNCLPGPDPAVPAELIDHIRAHLGQQRGLDWTAVHYTIHRDQLWMFILGPDLFEAHHITLDASLKLALQMLTAPDLSFRQFAYSSQPRAASLRRRLAEHLLPGRLLQRLHAEHHLVIVPSGDLHWLAFHALECEDKPLIEQTIVTYVRSLELLIAAGKQTAPIDEAGRKRGLVVAQSEFEMLYPPLPHAAWEAQMIAAQTGGPVEYLPAQRSELAKLRRRLGDFEWLHVTTHTQTDPQTGQVLGLVLADGVLPIKELARLRVSPRVVMLSGCQTALDTDREGEVPSGLAQAFLSAGAERVVASLWPTADRAAALLMDRFYRHFGQGVGPSAALAQAQREAHRAGVEPFHWAAFGVVGRT